MRTIAGSPRLLLWRGVLRRACGRLTGNARMLATGKTEQTLGRIALAHARVNRQAQHDLRRLQHPVNPPRLKGPPRLTLVR